MNIVISDIHKSSCGSDTHTRLTEFTLMLAVVWLWLSGEGLLPVTVPGEPRVGSVMSWMPCDRACCCFCRSLSS